MGSGEVVPVFSESVRSPTCPSIQFVKPFSHLFFKLLLLLFLYFNDTLFIYRPCCMACGILVPCPGMEPTPPAVEVWSRNHLTTRQSLLYTLFLLPLTTGSGDRGSSLTTHAQFSLSFLYFPLVGLTSLTSYLGNYSLTHLLRKYT